MKGFRELRVHLEWLRILKMCGVIIFLKCSWNCPGGIKFEMKHWTCQTALFDSENSFSERLSFQSGVWTEFRMKFPTKVTTAVVRHFRHLRGFPGPSGHQFLLQTQIWRSIPGHPPQGMKGFRELRVHLEWLRNLKMCGVIIFLKISWNFPEFFLKLSWPD